MKLKYFAAFIAIVLLLAYVAPIAWKLQEGGLFAVVLLGVGMAVIDLRQSLRGKD